jgi:TolB protein
LHHFDGRKFTFAEKMRLEVTLGLLVALFFGMSACTNDNTQKTDPPAEETTAEATDTLLKPQEKHLKNLQMLTNGGNNAEAYFSFDGQQLVFQSDYETWGVECDQIFRMSTKGYEGEQPKMISTGKGRTTCSYFMPGDQSIVYASTHLGGEDCPPPPPRTRDRYVWPIYASYDIFTADLEGNITGQLTTDPGYDAEATVSPDGKMIVFTSTRSGDLELWTMNIDGTNLNQVTSGLGYDGGAFFSPDSKRLVFRASRPKTEEEQTVYKDLLAQGLVEPKAMEIYVCNVDGSDMLQVTDLGGANWAPFFHPSGEKILFSSNHHSGGRQFNIFSVNLDGSGLEQITFDTVFDAFPMFSPDGKQLVFSSNRNNGGGRATNVFVADWVE